MIKLRPVIFAALGLLAPAAPAVADSGYFAFLPPCDHPSALQEIASEFAQKEARFWNSGLQIVDFLHVRQLAFRPWTVDAIPRRFCTGRVVVSDGVKRRVDYSIVEVGGMIGATWGVEWCVAGLDRNLAFAPNCRAARP